MPSPRARRDLLRALLLERPAASQAELQRRLRRIGIAVSQATVSRDLAAIGAERVRLEDGRLAYSPAPGAAPESRAAVVERLRPLVRRVELSGTGVVLGVEGGAEGWAAELLDRWLPAGGVAGVTTGPRCVVVHSRADAAELAERLAAELLGP